MRMEELFVTQEQQHQVEDLNDQMLVRRQNGTIA